MFFSTCSAGALSGRISVSSSLLAATMNQKSSLREDPQFVSWVLTGDNYDVPPEYGVREHRYTVVNGRTVLVEPRTRRIVEIVE